MAGLFGTFNIAKSGLSVTQSQIDTTSHNIANTNTTGYTRQRAVSATTTPYGGNSKYDSLTVGQVGTGAKITSIERIRDSFIDYQVRTQTTTNSSLDIQSQYLEQAEDILNETSDDSGIKSELSSFYNALQTLSTSAETTSNKTVVISQASTLASTINNKYTQLENIVDNLQESLNTNVTEINSTLDQLNKVNKQITEVTSLGLSPNDLMDTRDNLLDTLSEKFGINVTNKNNNGTTISSTDITGTNSVLVDGTNSTTNCTRFSYVNGVSYDEDTQTLKVSYYKLGDSSSNSEITLTGISSTDAESLKSSLEQNRILIADQDGTVNISDTTSTTELRSAIFTADGGEVGGNQEAQTTIEKTMTQLDKLAATIAYTVNAIQTGSTTSTDNLLFVKSGTDSDSGINAKNISVNEELVSEPDLLNAGKDSTSGEKDGTRALAMANLANLKVDFSKISDVENLTRDTFMSGTGLSFNDSDNSDYSLVSSSSNGTTSDDYCTTIVSELATSADEVNSELTTSETLLTSLGNQRTSVSGVSLDEEMTNLIQYQHAYEANAKIISTIDELLDVVINGLQA